MKVDKSSGLPEAVKKYAAQVSSTLQKKSRDVQATFNARIVNAKQLLSHIQATVKSSTVVKFLSSLPEEVKTHARVISKSVKQQQIDKQQKYFYTLLEKCEKNLITSKEAVKLADQFPSFIKTLPDDKANEMRARFRSAVYQNQNAQMYPQLANALIESSPNNLERLFTENTLREINLERFVAENTLCAIYDDNIKINPDSIAAVNYVISKRNDLIAEKQVDLKTNQGVIQSVLDEITKEWGIQLDFVRKQLGESHKDVEVLCDAFAKFKEINLASINDAKTLAKRLNELKLSIDSNSSNKGVDLKAQSAWMNIALLFKNDVISEILHTTHITTGLQEEINLVKSIPHHKGALSALCSDPYFPKDDFEEYVEFLKSCTFDSVASYEEFVEKTTTLMKSHLPDLPKDTDQATLLFEALMQSENTHLFSEVAQHYLDTISDDPKLISSPEYLPVLKAVRQKCNLMQEIWETKNSIERMPQPVRGDSLNLASCRALLEKCQNGKELTFQEEAQFERIRQFLNTIPPGKTRDELENKWNTAAVTLLSNNLIKNKPIGDETLKRAYIALNTDPQLVKELLQSSNIKTLRENLWCLLKEQYEEHPSSELAAVLIGIANSLQPEMPRITQEDAKKNLQALRACFEQGKFKTEENTVSLLIQKHPGVQDIILGYIKNLASLDLGSVNGMIGFSKVFYDLVSLLAEKAEKNLGADDSTPLFIYMFAKSENPTLWNTQHLFDAIPITWGDLDYTNATLMALTTYFNEKIGAVYLPPESPLHTS